MASAKDIQERLSQRIIDDFEKNIEELNRRVRALEERVEAIRGLGEHFWQNEAAAYLLARGATSWKCDAGDANTVFENVFGSDSKDGRPKRWVTKAGAIGAEISISRAQPLIFTVEIANFAVPALADALKLSVDDADLPWSVREKLFYSARIAAKPGTPTLKFHLSVPQDLIPAEKDVSFAFRSLSIAPA